MKTRIVLLSLVASLLAFGALAQTIESDDMYFSAKDRAKLKALKASEITASAKPVKKATLKTEEEEPVNPTDSYSARNVNPEFEARSNAQTAQSDNEDYFINDYKNATATDLNNWNNNFSSWYGSSWYTPNYYGSSINSWNSPYYGYNDPYMSPWYNPSWNNAGWSTSFSYYWGNSWNYGWGGNYNYWNQPYCGASSSFGPSLGAQIAWSSGGWYRPTTVIVVNNNNSGEGRHASYGHRGTRSTTMVSGNPRTEGTRGRTTVTTYPQQQSTDNGNNGRVASTNRSRQEYYNRSWRTTNTSDTSQSTTTPTQSSNSNWGWDNGNQRSTGSSYSNDRTPSTYTPSRSSSSSSDGGGRSSGSSSSGSSSSSGGRGRTRN